MSGKLRARAALVLGAAALLLSSGCPRNVGQSSASGKDARHKGAKKIEIEGNEGRSKRDIVTFPGGDRVDWKFFELPGPGTVEVKVRWKPPRPGLDLAFNVYDESFAEVATAKPSPKKPVRSKSVTVQRAKPGKYYVQVYAPQRGDAAEYQVLLRYKPGSADDDAGEPVASADDIPFPPTLPAVPEPGEPVVETPPPGGGPTEPPPGGDTQPVEQPAAQPVKAKVVNYQVSSGGLIITLNKGSDAGVDRGWSGIVLRGSSDSPMDGGEFKIIKVTNARSVGKVSMSVDQIKANRFVLLKP